MHSSGDMRDVLANRPPMVFSGEIYVTAALLGSLTYLLCNINQAPEWWSMSGDVQCNAAGQVVLKLKTALHDGTTHNVMSPLEFMQRLAALVPRPRLHLIRLVSA